MYKARSSLHKNLSNEQMRDVSNKMNPILCLRKKKYTLKKTYIYCYFIASFSSMHTTCHPRACSITLLPLLQLLLQVQKLLFQNKTLREKFGGYSSKMQKMRLNLKLQFVISQMFWAKINLMSGDRTSQLAKMVANFSKRSFKGNCSLVISRRVFV